MWKKSLLLYKILVLISINSLLKLIKCLWIEVKENFSQSLKQYVKFMVKVVTQPCNVTIVLTLFILDILLSTITFLLIQTLNLVLLQILIIAQINKFTQTHLFIPFKQSILNLLTKTIVLTQHIHIVHTIYLIKYNHKNLM